MAATNDAYFCIRDGETGLPGYRDESHLILAFCETENVLLEMLNKGQVISSLYTLKYIFGKITFCKKDKKIEIVKEIDDLKARTYSQRPGEN